MAEPMDAAPGTKPNPDPTVATNDAVERAMKSERDYVDGEIKVIAERLNGIDTATALRLRSVEEVPHMIDEKVGQVKELVGERFDSVGTQFDLVERQRVEQKKDTKDAVDAALAAAKEAVKEQTTASGLSIAKSEASTSEQLKQLSATFTTAIAGLVTQLDDLKDRINRGEGQKQGVAGTGQVVYYGVYLVIAVVGLYLATRKH